jgi:2-keto-4-pentenoate hydratase/2-oxohepta-3-ene-1,7-dioic acid hydratase in catechol pathway
MKLTDSAVKEIGIEPPKYPAMFAKFPNAVAGYGDDIEIAKLIQDNQVDYEGELVVVIGKDCKDVKYENAMDYVLGYTVGNDLSARSANPRLRKRKQPCTNVIIQKMAERP